MNMGIETFPGGHIGEPDLRPAPSQKNLPKLQGTARSAGASHARRWVFFRGSEDGKNLHREGLRHLQQDGYKGRVGLYEVMEINDELRELILVGASALELKKKALDQGMIMLRRSGLIKVAAG